jgi:hypothetical protein
MWSADLSRAEHVPFRSVPEMGQRSDDLAKRMASVD